MLPKDDWILLSYLNTKLRDEYASLSSLADDLCEDEAELQARMKGIGYVYSPENNRFER